MQTKTTSVPSKETLLKEGILRLYVFNVGQGDHILLKLPNNEYGIIDFFFDDELLHSPARYYFENLQKIYPEEEIKISFICLSHPDLDHLQGLESFNKWVKKNKIQVPQLWLFGGAQDPLEMVDTIEKIVNKHTHNLSDKVRHQVENKKNGYLDRLRTINELMNHTNSNGIKSIYDHKPMPSITDVEAEEFIAYSMGPLEKEVNKFRKGTFKSTLILSFFDEKYRSNIDKNLISTILLLKFEQFKLLFAGDTKANVLKKSIDDLINNKYKGIPDYKSHFIKGIHHGSRYSSSRKIWKAILKDDYKSTIHIGISAGRRYNHPHWITINEIFDAAQESNLQIKVNSTNNDIKRVKKHGYETESLDWIFQNFDSNEYDEDSNIALEEWRLKKPKQKKKEEKIGAYIYEFCPNKDEIKLILGMRNQKVKKD